jgi:uroporphyrin-III C-methyltransferase
LINGHYHPDKLSGMRLVVCATSDQTVNAKIREDATRAGILCCDASDASASEVLFPARADHGELAISVHSHARSPGASARMRNLISKLLEHVCPAQQAPTEGSTAARSYKQANGSVFIIGAGPGAADLITLRALRAIQAADVLIYDRILGRSFLKDLGLSDQDKTVEWLGAGRKGPLRQQEIHEKMRDSARDGKTVARIKNGDPFIFGRGTEEIAFLNRHGISWEVIPGLSASTSVPTSAGLPLTSRQQGRSFAVTSARLAGGTFNTFYPRADSLVVLMGAAVIEDIIQQLLEDGWSEETAAAVIEHGSLQTERHFHGTLADIASNVRQADITSPAILVVGHAAAHDLAK